MKSIFSRVLQMNEAIDIYRQSFFSPQIISPKAASGPKPALLTPLQ